MTDDLAAAMRRHPSGQHTTEQAEVPPGIALVIAFAASWAALILVIAAVAAVVAFILGHL